MAELDFENFVFLTEDDLYWKAYLSQPEDRRAFDLADAAASAIRSPTAWRTRRRNWRPTLLMLVILPFWTSFLIRVYAWIGILSNEGFLNQFLMWHRA